MHRPRALAGRAAVAGVALALLLGGCRSGGDSSDGASEDALACRGEWEDLGRQVQGNDAQTNPSALAPRWQSVAATIDYYATSATKSDCGEAISKQKDAISALTAFGEKLAPYDMELRLEQIRDDAETYAAGPRPPAPSPSPTPKNKLQKEQKQPPAPPAPAVVAAAVKSLTGQARVATQQQGPGWEQARVTELTDAAAVARTIKDLAFLSTQSPAYRSCAAALALIRVALAATG
jgi:hypothetical protein